ncbi:hypothetical protein BTEBP_20027 [Brochothrix thermosphacta]|nr:hypothetical protein BTEBP_20027 [Brochothrix thermosphacta]
MLVSPIPLDVAGRKTSIISLLIISLTFGGAAMLNKLQIHSFLENFISGLFVAIIN